MLNNENIMNDNELETVSGGYTETNGYAKGFAIICPKCGASVQADFETSAVDSLGQQFYRCRCGQAFLADAGGHATGLNGTIGQFNLNLAP